eukprot:2151891-Rhodomonas_salina.2
MSGGRSIASARHGFEVPGLQLLTPRDLTPRDLAPRDLLAHHPEHLPARTPGRALFGDAEEEEEGGAREGGAAGGHKGKRPPMLLGLGDAFQVQAEVPLTPIPLRARRY